MFHSTRGDTVADAGELFDFALKLVVEAVVGDLGGGHDGEGKRFKLARLASVVVHDGGAVRSQTEQEMVGRQLRVFCQHAPVPEFEVERDAQIAADVELPRDHLDVAAFFGQQFGHACCLMEADLVVDQHVFARLRALFAGEYLPDGCHVRQVNSRYWRQHRQRTCGENDGIWLLALDHLRRHLCSHMNFNACFENVALQVAYRVAELNAARHAHQQVDLTARFLLPLVEFDAKAALRRHFCRLHAARTASHDQQRWPALEVLRRQRARETQFVTRRGRLDAAQAEVQAHAPDTVLIAGDAEADGFGSSLAGFARKFGVADLAAHYVYHVGQPFAQDAFGLHGGFDATRAKNRQLDYLADARRDEKLVAGRGVHGAFNHVEVVKLANAGVDEIKLARCFQAACNLAHIIQRQASRNQFIAAEPDAEREVAANFGAHGLNHFQGEAHARSEEHT